MSKETEKICTGCGRSSLNPVSEQHLACCPDSNYIEMSNNKQSSVEWLINKLIEHQIIKIGQTTYGGNVNYKHEILLEQAKSMHKEEIIKANEAGFDDGNGFVEEIKYKSAEHYYNETFK